MESGNLHLQPPPQQRQQRQQQLRQDQQLLVGSSPSFYSSLAASISNYAWTPNISLNNNADFSENCHGVVISPNPIHLQKNEMLVYPPLSSMIQKLGSQWTSNASSHHDKEELSADSCSPKFTHMFNNSSINNDIEEHSHRDLNINDVDLGEKLLLKVISSGPPIMNNMGYQQFSPSGDQFYNTCPRFGRGSFSQIHPSINISNLNHQSGQSLDHDSSNLQALEFLRSCNNYRQTSSDHHHQNLGTYKPSSLSLGLDHLQQPSHNITGSCSSSGAKILPLNNNELTESKRFTGNLGFAPKKSRLVSRSSCPPFKVRKEKLGDRIAALQQLVAPLGKTDTASVLMEAIGCIKFLRNQVETLCIPYMKSCRHKTSRTTTKEDHPSRDQRQHGEAKKDLRSRGLCLVPLSCMSYVAGDLRSEAGGGIWPPAPTFG